MLYARSSRPSVNTLTILIFFRFGSSFVWIWQIFLFLLVSAEKQLVDSVTSLDTFKFLFGILNTENDKVRKTYHMILQC